MYNLLLNSIIVVLIILVVFLVSLKNTTTFSYSTMPGFYHADEDFCKDADLKCMYLYIGKPISSVKYDYPCYITIHANHGVVANQSFNANIFEQWTKPDNWIPFVGKNNKYYTVNFTDLNIEGFPSEMSMTYDPQQGVIRLFDGDKLYARLYKDNLASATIPQ